uniref:zinc metalloproteinase-disintegrin-like NaMP isoform X2 n=1 Tax=Pristiophorus japonicus TaxID=55135 RepID=UPI00398F0AF1
MVHARYLLCSLLFCSVAPELASSTSRLPDVQKYRVVKPRRLHAKQKRESEGLYPAIVQYGVTVEGKELVVHLEKNEHLIAKNYSETYYLENGTEVTSSPLYLDHCYYHGYIKGEGGSSASFSTCDGLSGYFRTNGQRYLMEPLKESDRDDHALYRYEELRLPLATCGVVNTTWDNAEPRVEESFSSASQKSAFLKAKKYIEMYVVADNSEYRKFGSIAAVKSRVFEAVNHINMLYVPLKAHIALVGVEIWSSGDKIFVDKDSGKTLSSMLKWRRSHLLPRKKHDNIQFITYVDFTGDTIGLAQVSAMCTGNSGAINQDHASNVHGVASTIAHEMGHNLGMDHDQDACVCRSKSCIMSPVLSSTLPTEFSSCSHQHFQSFAMTHTASCLRDVPSQDDIVAKPICGNRFVENGEDCDCGSPAECRNPCCDAQTCKLREGVQCADGACCQDCKFTSAGELCRSMKDDCDLPEMCDGHSNVCPKDTFRINGTPCKKDTGFCYNGKCPTHQEQCVSLWGSGAQPGPERCFQRNTMGDEYNYCTKTTRYQPCSPQNIMCGQLNCVGGTARPTFSTGTITIGRIACRVILDRDGIQRGLVQNGVKCGDNKMCLNAECTEVRINDCSSKCSEDMICNHLRQCQYEDGSTLRNTSAFPSFAIIIIVLIVLLFVIIAGVIIYKKHTNKNIIQSRSQPIPTSGLTNPAFTDSTPGTPQVPKVHHPKPSALRPPPQMPAPRPANPPAPKVLMPPNKRRY